MRLSDALENEKQRENPISWNKVYLHKEGKFFHIYEWSAWLVKNFVCTEEFQKERNDKSILQSQLYVTKKAEYVIIGFPVESLSKYIPQYKAVTQLEGNDLEIEVEIPFGEECSYEEIQEIFLEWRSTCPVKDSKDGNKKKNPSQNERAVMLSKSGIFSILAQVLSYPVELTTPSENLAFISKLKKDVSSLL